MRLTRILHVSVALLISIGGVFGQSAVSPSPSSEAEKSSLETEKKALSLLDRTIGDADSLRLPENRVYVFSVAGTLLWTRDEKRARQLFRRAANEFVRLFAANEEDGDELPENFRILQNSRNQLLNSVASRDAELAIELLRQTRPPVFERMLNLPPEKIKLYRNLHQQAQNELNQEKEFARQLIKQNPRRAVELARANLKKSVSTTDINLLNQLKDIEPVHASQYAEELLQKLIASDFSDANDSHNISLAQIFLSQFSAPTESNANEGSNKSNQFKIDKNSLGRLAVKYADFLSGNTQFLQHNYHFIQNALPIFERLLPERVSALRQKYERLKQNNSAQNPHNQYQDHFNQLNGNAEAQTLIEEAENFPLEMRPQLYASAANKMAQAGNYAAGRQLLVSLPGKQARQNALGQFDSQYLYKFLSEEKYAEAEQIIAQQTEPNLKIRFLVQTANHFASKKQNEKATQYLAQARSLVNPNPENYLELSNLMQVLTAGAEGDTEKTFDLLDSFVPKFNEIFAATAFLNKYQPGYGSFREDEVIFTNNNFDFISFSRRSFGGTIVSLNAMRLDSLGKANLERTMSLADRFERSDVRIAARMMILRGVLLDGKNPESHYPVID
ncbi:MAG: hypothetical protein M3209_12790 [Acidobacteriota bacterium]|nr:hypothetical protein [Acidobacteriota bacterium]